MRRWATAIIRQPLLLTQGQSRLTPDAFRSSQNHDTCQMMSMFAKFLQTSVLFSLILTWPTRTRRSQAACTPAFYFVQVEAT